MNITAMNREYLNQLLTAGTWKRIGRGGRYERTTGEVVERVRINAGMYWRIEGDKRGFQAATYAIADVEAKYRTPEPEAEPETVPFRLVNDEPATVRCRGCGAAGQELCLACAERTAPRKQLRLFTGLDCARGQLDLFNTDGRN